ncbi:MAG: RNA methyltransferase [Flavobacteriales bacterium]
MPEITKNQLKHIRLLKQKKYRQEYGEFVVEGEKNVNELLNSSFKCLSVFATEEWESRHELIAVTKVTKKQLSQISNLSSPDKVLAIASIPIPNDKQNLEKGLTLCLDSINDPGNLGTIIRTADWFGVKNIICSPNSVDCFNSKVVQSTKGSIFNIELTYRNLAEVFTETDKPVFGAALDGEVISNSFSVHPDCFLLMGSESHGINSELEKFVTNKIKIPKIGKAESLNVAIATSILLHQFTTK